MEQEIIIDAKGSVVGRLATFAAKQALQGKNVIVVNSEYAVIIGDPRKTFEDYVRKMKIGHGAQKGPFYPKQAYRILQRAIRGMLAHKSRHGAVAFRRVKCYESVPHAYSNKEKTKLAEAEAVKFITLKDLSRKLGK